MDLYLDPETTMDRLSYAVLSKIADEIGRDWRKLATVVPEEFSYCDIENLADAMYMGEQPAMRLLHRLQTTGKTVRHLISYLDKLRLENALRLLKAPEKLVLLKQPESGIFQEGSTAKVECSVEGFPYPQYQWFHVYTPEESTEPSFRRLPEGVDKVLTINNIMKEHCGGYFCTVYHILPDGMKNQIQTKMAYVTVAPPAEYMEGEPPIIYEQPRDVRTRVGKPIHLKCKAYGKPDPQYQWYKLGHDDTLHKILREIKWENAKMEDQGKYMCKVWNQIRGRENVQWSNKVTVRVSMVPSPEESVIKIERHPESATCLIGEKQAFECQVICKVPVKYQWYKDDKKIPGEVKIKLMFDSVREEDQGEYYCEMWNEAGRQESNRVTLNFIKNGVNFVPETKYFATDKIALLIGNMSYRGIDALTAVSHDVMQLQTCLQFTLKFKCLSLMNLNKSDLQKAVDVFCNLITENSYVVFYFSGHGFQHLDRTYMVPVDAHMGYTSEESVCVQDVQLQMQQRKPALNAIFLDICRSRNDCEKVRPIASAKSHVLGNSVIFWASNTDSEAYELKGEGGFRPRGIFSDYLTKRIVQDVPITRMMDQVRMDVASDPNVAKERKMQFPDCRTDLCRPLSLHDPIRPTKDYQLRRLVDEFWTPLFACGEFTFKIEQVAIELVWRWAFTNVMRVEVKTPNNPNVDLSMEVWPHVHPNNLSCIDLTTKDKHMDPCCKVWHVVNIQKAQPLLVISLNIGGKLHRQKVVFTEIMIAKTWKQIRQAPVSGEGDYPDSTSGEYPSSGFSARSPATVSLNKDTQ